MPNSKANYNFVIRNKKEESKQQGSNAGTVPLIE
jgi:hypothetical protein